MINQNTPLAYLTVSDLQSVIEEAISRKLQESVTVENKSKEKWLVHGLSELAELFGCSIRRAHEIKNSGIIDKAVSQIGRTIVVDAEKALELAQKAKVKQK